MLTETEAADHLGVDTGTLRSLRELGRPPAYFKLGQIVRYKESDLDAFAGSPAFESLFQRFEPTVPVAGVAPTPTHFQRIEPVVLKPGEQTVGAVHLEVPAPAEIAAARRADPIQEECRPQFARSEFDPFRGLSPDQIAGCGTPPGV